MAARNELTEKDEYELTQKLKQLRAIERAEKYDGPDYYDEGDERDPAYYFYDDDNNYFALRHSRGDMPNSTHNDLVEYLLDALRWYYRDFSYNIERKINFYQTDDPDEVPLYPDFFLRKSEKRVRLRSYRIKPGNPPPELIIEVASDDTVSVDMGKKVEVYAKWGVTEYFVYDPRPRVRKLKKPRLYGWRLVNGKYQVLVPQSDGRIWSEQIQSWLVPQGEDMKLYDSQGNLRLRKGEAEEQAKNVALHQFHIEEQRAEGEKRAKEAALRQIEEERQAKEAERQRADAERQAKEAAQAEIERLQAELRRLKGEPD